MINPLSDNPRHLRQLCTRLQLGKPVKPLQRILGGFHHLMWKLETDRGNYAIKQLAADTDVSSEAVLAHYNLTEAIAERFTHYGINALHALKAADNYLQVCERTAYLVYPWCDAQGGEVSLISEQRGLQIARVLATMHRADIQVQGLSETDPKALSRDEITDLVNKAERYCVHKAKLLRAELNEFYNIAAQHHNAIDVLRSHQVISHGDLDQKNVMWNARGEPVLIDWESARRLNPTCEIILAALDWGGIASSFDPALFAKIIRAYRQAGGRIDAESVAASFQCILGDWLTWLLYTIARAVDRADPEQHEEGSAQVDWILPTILRLRQVIPQLLLMQDLYSV